MPTFVPSKTTSSKQSVGTFVPSKVSSSKQGVGTFVPSTASPKKSGGGGFWGTLGKIANFEIPGAAATRHYVSHKWADQAVQAAYHAPGAFEMMAHDLYAAPKAWVQHGYNSQQSADAARKITHDFVDPAKKGISGLAHGHIDFNNTLGALSVVPAAGGVAGRLAGAARAGSTVEKLAALARRPQYVHTYKLRDLTIKSPASNNPLVRIPKNVQLRRLHEQAAREPGGKAYVQLSRKAQKPFEAQQQTLENIGLASANALGKISNKLNKGQQEAFRVHAEGKPLAAAIKMHEASIGELRNVGTRAARGEILRHQKVLRRLVLAKQYLAEDGLTLRGKGALGHSMQDVYDKAFKESRGREGLIKELGIMSGPELEAARAAAGRVTAGARYKDLGPGYKNLSGDEDFTNPGGIKISEAQRQGPIGKAVVATRGKISGAPRLPASLSKTNTFTGASKLHALETETPVRRVAESSLEIHRLMSGHTAREMLAKAGVKSPTTDDLGAWRFLSTGKATEIPLELKNVIQKADRGEALTEADHGRFANAWVQFKKEILQNPEHLSQDQIQGLHDLAAKGQGVWVPRHLTRPLENDYVRLENLLKKRPTQFVDGANNAARIATILFKVAYVAPNLVSNAGLLLIRQGFMAPVNLARASIFAHRIPADVWAELDTHLGEGGSLSLAGVGRGPIGGTAHALGSALGKIVDTPIRRAMILHEMRLQGVKTVPQIRELLSGKDIHKLTLISQRANRSAIIYSALSNRERELFRRVIFVYPWVKGSTVYSGHFLKEHTVQASILANKGKQFQDYQYSKLGPVPYWGGGLIPAGQGKTRNPQAAGIFGSPADIIHYVENFNPRDPLAGLGNFLFPWAQGGLGSKSVPIISSIKGLLGHPTSKTFPQTPEQSLLTMLLGRPFVPVNTDVNRLHAAWYKEHHPRKY